MRNCDDCISTGPNVDNKPSGSPSSSAFLTVDSRLLRFLHSAQKVGRLQVWPSVGLLFEVSFTANRFDGLFLESQWVVSEKLCNTDA